MQTETMKKYEVTLVSNTGEQFKIEVSSMTDDGAVVRAIEIIETTHCWNNGDYSLKQLYRIS